TPPLPNTSLLQSQLGNLQSQLEAAQLQEDVLRRQLGDAHGQVRSLGAEKQSLLDDICSLRQLLDSDNSADLEKQLQAAEARLVRNAQEASTACDRVRRLEVAAEQANALLDDNRALKVKLGQLLDDHDALDDELQVARQRNVELSDEWNHRCEELQATLRARKTDFDEARQALQEKAAELEQRLESAIRSVDISDEARHGLLEKAAQLERMVVEAYNKEEAGSNIRHELRERCMALEGEIRRLTMGDRRRACDDPNEPVESPLHKLRGEIAELEDTLQHEKDARQDAETQLRQHREAEVQLRREVAMRDADIQILQHDHSAERDRAERLWEVRYTAAGAADKRMRLALEEELTVARESAEMLKEQMLQLRSETQALENCTRPHGSQHTLDTLDMSVQGPASTSEFSTGEFTPTQSPYSDFPSMMSTSMPMGHRLRSHDFGRELVSPDSGLDIRPTTSEPERQQSEVAESDDSSPHYRLHTVASKAKIRTRVSDNF
ncbi:MAG: hypothetical protein KVP17_000444, partial [Porospora cf. gigantea B]